jgi:hypothetical protein
MPKYEVTVEFKGRVKVEVDASDLNAAGKKALTHYHGSAHNAKRGEEQIVAIATVT